MDFWGVLAILAGVAIVLRILRRLFKWVDYLIWAIMVIVPIIAWISEGFIVGVVTFFGVAIAASLLGGFGNKTEIRRFGHKYSLNCEECGYDSLEIIGEEDNVVVTKCKRCGNVCSHILNR
jgi:hypothetical protein